jgi:Fic family protein
MLWDRIDTLLRNVEAQRRVLDQGLSAPARWSGLLRRELHDRSAPLERARVAAAFNQFSRPPFSTMPLTLHFLQALHDQAVGGFDFRERPVIVRSGDRDSFYRPPVTNLIAELTARALDRANDGREPAVLAAARLHLELLLIHPFSDGNGRAARLLSSLLLIRAGYRSTLFTAVEQHFSENPSGYSFAFEQLSGSGGRDQWSWLVAAIEAMAGRSRLAFLHRTGELSLSEVNLKTRCDLALQLARIDEEERVEFSLTADP